MAKLIRTLFQGQRATGPISRLAKGLRVVIRGSVEQTGSGRQVAAFAKRFPRLFTHIGGLGAFPSDPRHLLRIGGLPPLPTAIGALEFLSLTLLPVVPRLRAFRSFVESELETPEGRPADELPRIFEELSKSFGFSAWLAGEEASRLDTDEEASTYFRELQLWDRLQLPTILVHERYVAVASSTAVTEIEQHVASRKYHEALHSLVTAWIHPAPRLSDHDIAKALALAVHLPAIDRLLILQRCIGAFLAQPQMTERVGQLASTTATLEVIDSIGGAFAENLARLLGRRSADDLGAARSPHLIEAILADVLAAPALEPANFAPSPLRSALAGLTAPDFGVAAGHLAVLARQAVVEASSRTGTVLASVVAQCATLTEQRAQAAIVWVRLFGHSSLVAASNGGRIGHSLRLLRAGDRRQRFEALAAAASRGDHHEVIALAETSGTPTLDETAILLDALLAANRVDSAIECATSIIVDHPLSAERLPISELVEILPDSVATDIRSAVHRAVLAAFCARFDVAGAATKRNDSLEDVLECADVAFPSDAVDTMLAAVPRGVALQFLENVCVPQVMDTVPVGRSTEQLLNERIKILNILRGASDRSRESNQRFEVEMKEHATYLAVTSELASLDQRRIYVDTEGLRARLGTTLAGDYQRYRRFAAFEVHADSDLDQLRQLLQEQFPDTVWLDLNELTRALTSESDRALSKMLLDIRDAFAISHEFGLDGYLSGGIRHGNLEFHLREPFITGNLLGVLHTDGRFSPPAFAESLLANCTSGEERERIHESFHRLARDLRTLIDEVLMEWIQVALDDSNPKAFFRLSMIRLEARALASKLRQAATLDEFIDICVRYWWSVVDQDLQRARQRVRNELHERLLKLLRELERDCTEALCNPALGEVLRNQIGTVTDSLDSAITKLAEWFRRPAESATGDVEATTAIDVCLRLLHGTFPNAKIQTAVSVTPFAARLSRRDFKHWVDIIHVLLINAAEHGGAGEALSIGIDWVFATDAIRLGVTNAIGPHVHPSLIDSRLEASRKRREEEATSLRHVRTEGSSGLIKALKYARADLRCPGASVDVARREGLVEARVVLPGKDWIHSQQQAGQGLI